MPELSIPHVILAAALSTGSQEEGGGSLSYANASEGLRTVAFEGGGSEFELADVNDDGNLDILTIGDHGNPLIGSGEEGIMVYFGNGIGRWTLVQGGQFGYGGIAVGDVDNDGHLDVGYGMHHNYSGTDLGDQLLEVALGDGTGTSWTPWDDGLAMNGETWGMFATDFADVDNDGLLDVLSNSFGCCAGVHVYRNEGDGTWTQTFGFVGGNASPIATFGDVNGDGNADFATVNQMGSVWLGDGEGGFVNVDGNLPGTAQTRYGLDLGDVNGDGRDEIVFRNGTSLELWQYQGNATWTSVSQGLPSSGFTLAQIADMDADGMRDIAAFGNGRIGVWRFTGGAWTQAADVSLAASGTAEAMRTGLDADHNGRPDLVLFQDESCGLFCSRNRLYFYRESTPPTALGAFVAYPRGGEVWRAGSVRTIEWFSAVPTGSASSVDVELSTSGPAGPWTTLASGAPNDGQLQLVVPASLDSSDCYVRVVASTATEVATATSAAQFSILPPRPRPEREESGRVPF